MQRSSVRSTILLLLFPASLLFLEISPLFSTSPKRPLSKAFFTVPFRLEIAPLLLEVVDTGVWLPNWKKCNFGPPKEWK